MGRNPYEPLSEEEKVRIEAEKKELSERTKAVIKLASECLGDEKFKKYREELEKLKSDTFRHLKDPIDPDPIKDAHYLRACINTIIVLDMLLNAPGKDIK